MAVQSKVREELAKRFTEALEMGQLPWQACWSQERQHNAVTGVKYRGINAAWLSYYADSKGWSDPRWCTFNQAREKGWSVRKGEKATHVEYWAYFDTKQDKLLSWDAVHKLLRADPDYEKNLQLRCRTYAVFNGAQIDGIPEYTKSQQTDIGEIRAQRDTLIANMGVGYEEHGIEAFYSPARDTVVLPPEATFDDTYSYMATFLHECGHATGHESRLDRPLDGYGADPESYANEELRAEIASAFTAQALGLQLTPAQQEAEIKRHMAYVQSWASHIKDAPEALFKAIKDAEKISDYLIEKGEFQPIIDRAQEVEKQQEAVQEESAQLEHAEPIPAVLTPLQEKSLEIVKKYETLPMQDKIEKMALSFGATTGTITTSPCSGKWRGTSDVSIQFDNGASLFIGNHATPKARTKKVREELVNAAFAQYNSEIINATKELAFPILKEREARDNAIAAEKGLKPYTLLNVEFNDGTDEQVRGYMGWYYVTLEVDGKICAHMETGLNYDIAGGKVTPAPTRENYYTAGALKENEVDYVFNNVGFSSASTLYSLPLTDVVLQRAERTLAEKLIDDYCCAEFSGIGADFGDPSAIGIGYTTVTDEEIPIQASVNLKDFSIDRYLGEVLIDRRQYGSLGALIQHELRDLDFDDLTNASEAELAVLYAHDKERAHEIMSRNNGNLDLTNTAITELPVGLKVAGDLNIQATEIQSLAGITVGGNLLAAYSKIESISDLEIGGDLDLACTKIVHFPDSVKVGGNIDLSNTPIQSLPDDLHVHGRLDLYESEITDLPKNLTINDTLNLRNTKIRAIPEDIHVHNLDLESTPIRELPDGLSIGGYLDLSDTLIQKLPQDLSVGGNIYLRGSDIQSLPDNFTVHGNLDLRESSIAELPENLLVTGNLELRDTDISRIPESLRVGGVLDIRYTAIESVPAGVCLSSEEILGKAIPHLLPNDEALYLCDDTTYLHVQLTDNGWDYTLYDKETKKQIDGGVISPEAIEKSPVQTLAGAIRAEVFAVQGMSPEKVSYASTEIARELQEAQLPYMSRNARLQELIAAARKNAPQQEQTIAPKEKGMELEL